MPCIVKLSAAGGCAERCRKATSFMSSLSCVFLKRPSCRPQKVHISFSISKTNSCVSPFTTNVEKLLLHEPFPFLICPYRGDSSGLSFGLRRCRARRSRFYIRRERDEALGRQLILFSLALTPTTSHLSVATTTNYLLALSIATPPTFFRPPFCFCQTLPFPLKNESLALAHELRGPK